VEVMQPSAIAQGTCLLYACDESFLAMIQNNFSRQLISGMQYVMLCLNEAFSEELCLMGVFHSTASAEAHACLRASHLQPFFPFEKDTSTPLLRFFAALLSWT
jgi:hypothetical protein